MKRRRGQQYNDQEGETMECETWVHKVAMGPVWLRGDWDGNDVEALKFGGKRWVQGGQRDMATVRFHTDQRDRIGKER